MESWCLAGVNLSQGDYDRRTALHLVSGASSHNRCLKIDVYKIKNILSLAVVHLFILSFLCHGQSISSDNQL